MSMNYLFVELYDKIKESLGEEKAIGMLSEINTLLGKNKERTNEQILREWNKYLSPEFRFKGLKKYGEIRSFRFNPFNDYDLMLIATNRDKLKIDDKEIIEVIRMSDTQFKNLIIKQLFEDADTNAIGLKYIELESEEEVGYGERYELTTYQYLHKDGIFSSSINHLFTWSELRKVYYNRSRTYSQDTYSIHEYKEFYENWMDGKIVKN